MTLRSPLLVLVACWIAHPCVGADTVTLTPGAQSVKVTIGDEVFTVFQHGTKYAKPFFLPVTAPGAMAALQENLGRDLEEGSLGRKVFVCSESAPLRQTANTVGAASFGEILEVSKIDGPWMWVPEKQGWIHSRDAAPLAGTITRLISDSPSPTRDRRSPDYYDHPHHKGLWLSIDEVNGIPFWAEKGRIENRGVEIVASQGTAEQPAVLKYVNHWLGSNGDPVVVEETTVRISPDRLMTFDIHFRADKQDVTFGDTKEGLFAIRLPNSMRELISEGPVTSAEGVQGTKELWGKPAAWIDYCGRIDGRTYGVTLMDHPDNPQTSRYHVRDYGLFAVNPFGRHAYTNKQESEQPVTIKPGDGGVVFRYGLYVHDGLTQDAPIAEAFTRFTSK